MPVKIPRPKSAGEEEFALHCRAAGIKVEREFKFHPVRKWKADFAIPSRMILIEIEGITRQGDGRHQTFKGYSDDCEKYSHAALLGYRVFRFTTAMVKSGDAISMIEAAT